MTPLISSNPEPGRSEFHGRLAVQQRVLPAYRAPFFARLAARCVGGLAIFAGEALEQEAIPPANGVPGADFTRAENRHFFHPRHPLYVCNQTNLLDWIETADPDALIVEANPRYLSTPAAIRWMHQRGRPVLGWGLGAPPGRGILQGRRVQARRKLLASLDGIIAYSQRGAREYAALNILPKDQIFTAENAVAGPPIDPPPARTSDPQQPARLLFVGRLQARKKLPMLFEALANLEGPHPPALTVVGDGPARGDFEHAAQSIYPSTIFLGALYGEALAQVFRQANLFVLPGTGGLAIQEAMSHALPVIVARGDGTQDDLVRPANGWQVEPDRPQALLAALQEALSDSKRLQEMGRESYRIVRDEINIERMADKMVAAVKAIISSGGPADRQAQEKTP